MSQPPRRPRTTTDARSAAEAAFKAVTAPRVEAPVKKAAIPGVKEQVTLRIDQDVLEHFQAGRARLAGQDQRRPAQGRRKIELSRFAAAIKKRSIVAHPVNAAIPLPPLRSGPNLTQMR